VAPAQFLFVYAVQDSRGHLFVQDLLVVLQLQQLLLLPPLTLLSVGLLPLS
jgi:hypothetical protein